MLFGKKLEWLPLRARAARFIVSTCLFTLMVCVAKAQTAAPPLSIVDGFAAKDNSTVVDKMVICPLTLLYATTAPKQQRRSI